jgi:hypothetical protein
MGIERMACNCFPDEAVPEAVLITYMRDGQGLKI